MQFPNSNKDWAFVAAIHGRLKDLCDCLTALANTEINLFCCKIFFLVEDNVRKTRICRTIYPRHNALGILSNRFFFIKCNVQKYQFNLVTFMPRHKICASSMHREKLQNFPSTFLGLFRCFSNRKWWPSPKKHSSYKSLNSNSKIQCLEVKTPAEHYRL